MTKITLPATMRVEATDTAFRFVPYKENFVTTVPAGKSLALKATTVGQYFYYAKQGFTADATAADITVNVPAKITIKNSSDKVMNFIPYRENFQVEVKPAYINEDGESVAAEEFEFEAETAGQVLYYLAQDTSDISIAEEKAGGLDVNQAAKA